MKLPNITGKELVKSGFRVLRQESSHVFLQHNDGRTTVVPIHAGETIDVGLLNKIIKKDLGLSREEFMKYLRS